MKQKIKEEIKKFLVVDKEYEIIPDDILEAIDLAISKTEKETASEIIEQINNAQLELCKEENYSLNGDKKICCISELMVLAKELKKKFGVE